MKEASIPVLPWTGERLLTDDYNDNTLEHLHRYAFALQFCQEKRVLDIASGEGYGSALLADVAGTMIGVDIDNDTIKHAESKYKSANLSFIQGSATDIPITDDSVDVVVSFETLEHHDQHEEMLAEIKRVLTKTGTLIISTPDKLNYSERYNYENPFHVKELYREEFSTLINNHFKHVALAAQRVAYGSLLVPEYETRGFYEAWGDYDTIEQNDGLREPLYLVAVASDSDLPALSASFFDGGQEMKEKLARRVQLLEHEVESLRCSRSFRIGQSMIAPLLIVRKLKSALHRTD